MTSPSYSRRGRFGQWVLLLSSALFFLMPLAARALPLRSGTAVFTATGPRDTLFVLPVTWVILDSIRVARGDQPLSEFVEWRMVEPGNRVWVYRPLGSGDTLRVTYDYRPIPLYRSYVRHTLGAIARPERRDGKSDTSRIVSAAPSESAQTEGWTRLSKAGSLIRSVQVGTGQDLQLESALNLQIQGRVGRDVDVVAALTDQSTPIQPEGTTETLRELEKVFVSVRAPHLETTLGDYTLDFPGGQYDSYSRRLSGVFGRANYGGVSLSAGGAASRGQFFTNTFDGQEANQGPYALRGRSDEIGIIVVAGTEKVWLDGELLRRGEGNDYSIDYGAGEVTFTSRRMITSNSRIVVDFEYASEQYERFFGAGRIEGSFGDDRAGGGFTYVTESDDRTRPINLGLTDADRTVLAAAGDHADSSVVATADSVGLRGGDYVRTDTTYAGSVYSIFVYVPPDTLPNGQWHVFFGDFGVGGGEYEGAADSLGLTYYRWVGPGLGRYRPFRRLPLPSQHSLTDLRLHGSPVSGLRLDAEIAASQHDLNTFSSSDDADNDGVALAGGARFVRERPTLLGVRPYRVDADVRLRHRDRHFSELSRASEVEFQREWDAVANTGYEETIREARLRLSPVREVALSGGYGDLKRSSQSSSRRRTLGVTLGPWHDWSLAASHLALQSDDSATARSGDWIRQSGSVTGKIGRFAPRAGIDRERKRDRLHSLYDGFRFVDYRGGLGVALPANLGLDGEYDRRLDDRLSDNGDFRKFAEAYTATSSAAWTPAEGGRTSLRYAHREKQYDMPDSADVVSDVGRLETLLVPRSRLYEVNVVYEAAKTRSQNQILAAIEVPEGTGNYRREGDQYIPDDQGNCILVPRATGTYEPATELTLNALLWLRPDELARPHAAQWLRALSTESELVIEERTRLPLSARLLLLDPSRFRGDSTLRGSVSFRQDLHLMRLSQKLSLRLRYRELQSLENQYLNGGESRTTREGGARVRARYLAFWRGESEAMLSRESLTYRALSLPDRDVDRTELSQANTFSLSRRWETGVDLRALEARDERTGTQVSLRELKPHVAFTLFGKGRLDGDFSWAHATSNKAAIPFELARGANRGENLRWSLRGTYQFGENFSGSLNYSARRDAGEKIYHTGRLEARASF